MEEFIIFLIGLITTLTAIIVTKELLDKRMNEYKKGHSKQKEIIIERNQQYYPYHRTNLLTQNEYYFYKKLKEIHYFIFNLLSNLLMISPSIFSSNFLAIRKSLFISVS